MARISYTKSKNCLIYYIIEDYKRNGKRTTRKLEKIGDIKEITELAAKDNIDVNSWLNNYLLNYRQNHVSLSKSKETIVKKYSNKLIPINYSNKFNVGYLFLKDIYYSLRIDKILKDICKKYQLKNDLNEGLSNLIFSRIIYSASKLNNPFLEAPAIDLNNLYKTMPYLNNDWDYAQKTLYNYSKSVITRDPKITYFYWNNYPLSIKNRLFIKMGMFIDDKGLPLAINVFTDETKHFISFQEKIIKEYNLDEDKLIICTDKIDQINNQYPFVVTQSINNLKKKYKDIIFDDNDWQIKEDDRTYNLSDILNNEEKYKKHYETLFYKIIKIEINEVVQDLVVTFQIKYRDYLQNIRDRQIKRAKNKICSTNGKKIKLSNDSNDFRRFIKEEINIKKTKQIKDENGKKSFLKSYSYSIDYDKVQKEEKYDGYYAVITNIPGDISEILTILKNRRKIEESFKMLPTDCDFETKQLSIENRITTHFVINFLSLLIYRILENKLSHKYPSIQIIKKLKDMEVYEEKGSGYSPSYIRDSLTDDLHALFGFRTDLEILSYEDFDGIFKAIKNRTDNNI